jgi:hypothetical protein
MLFSSTVLPKKHKGHTRALKVEPHASIKLPKLHSQGFEFSHEFISSDGA